MSLVSGRVSTVRVLLDCLPLRRFLRGSCVGSGFGGGGTCVPSGAFVAESGFAGPPVKLPVFPVTRRRFGTVFVSHTRHTSFSN